MRGRADRFWISFSIVRCLFSLSFSLSLSISCNYIKYSPLRVEWQKHGRERWWEVALDIPRLDWLDGRVERIMCAKESWLCWCIEHWWKQYSGCCCETERSVRLFDIIYIYLLFCSNSIVVGVPYTQPSVFLSANVQPGWVVGIVFICISSFEVSCVPQLCIFQYSNFLSLLSIVRSFRLFVRSFLWFSVVVRSRAFLFGRWSSLLYVFAWNKENKKKKSNERKFWWGKRKMFELYLNAGSQIFIISFSSLHCFVFLDHFIYL